MALVAFLRGVNVGGHRKFQPSLLAQRLSGYGVVNLGAAGTFVVKRPGSKSAFRAALLSELPFQTEVMLCEGSDVLSLVRSEPFGRAPSGAGTPDAATVPFVSVLAKPGGVRPALPIFLPPEGEWLVQLIAVEKQFVLGVYRRHLKAIGYLGRIDSLLGATATTRNWNTMLAIARLLERIEEAP